MKCRLEDIANLQKGFAFKSKDFIQNGIKIVKVTNLTDESIDLSGCVHMDESLAEEYERYSLQSDDIIITTVGSWPTNPASVVGKVVKVPKEANKSLLNQNAVRVRSNGKVNQKYLYCLLRSDEFREYIISTAQGSANQASITQKDIKNFKYEIPERETQDYIAYILSTLDEKIEVNNQINKTLETMAQAIFKQWFVDFEFPNEEGEPYKSSGGEMIESELGMIPQGWKVGCISDIAINKKIAVKADKICKSENYIGLEHIPRKKLSLDSWEIASKIGSNKYRFNTGDILFGKLRPYFHKVSVAPIDGVCSTDILVVEAKIEKYYSYLVMKLFSKEIVDFATSVSTGTRMPRANWNDISGYVIVLPIDSILDQFSKIVLPILKRFEKSIKENTSLLNIRDTLLPKLMSGEIRVPLKKEADIS